MFGLYVSKIGADRNKTLRTSAPKLANTPLSGQRANQRANIFPNRPLRLHPSILSIQNGKAKQQSHLWLSAAPVLSIDPLGADGVVQRPPQSAGKH